MVGPLSTAPDVDGPDGDPLVVGVDDERADEVLSALSATTTRRVLAVLHDDPAPPSALASRLDTSIQNVQYHLEKLEDAGLVEAAGTTYSEKGREMTVYRPADRALVFVAGPGDSATDEGVLATLKRLLGGVGVLGLASLVVERLLGPPARQAAAPGPDTDAGYQSTATDGQAANQSTTLDAGGETAADDAEATGTEAATGGDGAPTGTEAADATPSEAAEATGTEAAEATGTEAASTAADAAPSATEAAQDTVSGGSTTPSGTAEAAETVAEATRMATRTVATTADGAIAAVAASPGLLFFLGGLTALLLVLALYSQR